MGELIAFKNRPRRKRGKKPSIDDRIGKAGPCPVQCLGHDGGRFFYITPSGQFRELAARQHRESDIDALFDGDPAWPQTAFPKYSAEGRHYHEGDIRRYLMRQCAAQGLFDPARFLRGPGVWRTEDGGLIVHAGDKLLVDGHWYDAGKGIGDFIYPAYPGEMRPAAKPATVEDAAALHKLLETWNWRAPAEAPRLLLGWIAQGYIPGALDWRSHVWTTGDKHTGKSWLANLLIGLLGTLTLHASDASAAGVRQALAGAARPVILDEIEQDPSNTRARDVVTLARLCSTEGQGPVLRGSTEGKARKWPMRACVSFSSIYYPDFLPQDAARICVLELDKMDVDPAVSQDALKRIERMGRLGPRFYGRMIQGWPRLVPNLEAFEAAIASSGRRSRLLVQLGTLLACAEILLSDEVIPLKKAVDFVGQMDIAAIADKHPEEGWELCQNHLYSSVAPDWRMGQRETIGQILERAVGPGEYEIRNDLKALGLKLIADDLRDWMQQQTHTVWLGIAHHHRGLEQIFANSQWGDGVWVQAFKRAPGARTPDRPFYFAGARSRAVLLPFRSVNKGHVVELEDLAE